MGSSKAGCRRNKNDNRKTNIEGNIQIPEEDLSKVDQQCSCQPSIRKVPHDDPLVIMLEIEGFNTRRVLVDNGSLADIMYMMASNS